MTGVVGRYRKRPVVISARGPITVAEDIVTLEGTMRADVGDYVITGIAGERYPCKPTIFEQTYEPVEGMAVVGEAGPEPVVLPAGASVVPLPRDAP